MGGNVMILTEYMSNFIGQNHIDDDTAWVWVHDHTVRNLGTHQRKNKHTIVAVEQNNVLSLSATLIWPSNLQTGGQHGQI